MKENKINKRAINIISTISEPLKKLEESVSIEKIEVVEEDNGFHETYILTLKRDTY
jgi:hypothetical protein